jgi:hypothetical protein
MFHLIAIIIFYYELLNYQRIYYFHFHEQLSPGPSSVSCQLLWQRHLSRLAFFPKLVSIRNLQIHSSLVQYDLG